MLQHKLPQTFTEQSMTTSCLPNWHLSPKLIAMVGVLLIGFALFTAYMLNKYHATLMQERQAKTQRLVDNASNLVSFYYDKMLSGELSEDQAKRYALAAVKQVSFEQESYYWVMDTHPRMVMHPVQPHLDGTDLSDYIGPDGKKLFFDMINIVKNNGAGYIEYEWTKPGTPKGTLYPKISYIKIFDPWQWIIGTGVYIDDVNAAFWSAIYVTAGLSLTILMFILALVMTVSESLKKP